MAKIFGKLEGTQTITDELILHGMIAGDAIVENGGLIQLHGMVAGDLIIKPGGYAHVHGMVTGSVSNGGYARITGVVTGKVLPSLEGSGETVIVPGSIVDGVVKRDSAQRTSPC